jgi:hypothetical protein
MERILIATTMSAGPIVLVTRGRRRSCRLFTYDDGQAFRRQGVRSNARTSTPRWRSPGTPLPNQLNALGSQVASLPDLMPGIRASRTEEPFTKRNMSMPRIPRSRV